MDRTCENKPCGGCGAKTDRERCIGCLHDFGTPESAWVKKYTGEHKGTDNAK